MITKNASSYCLVMVTVPSEEEGKKIAQALLTEKLAACISMTPVNSIYTWQGEVNHDREWQLFIKTRFNLFSQLAEKIPTLHSYDVPEIIALPMLSGSQPYLNWIADLTPLIIKTTDFPNEELPEVGNFPMLHNSLII